MVRLATAPVAIFTLFANNKNLLHGFLLEDIVDVLLLEAALRYGFAPTDALLDIIRVDAIKKGSDGRIEKLGFAHFDDLLTWLRAIARNN